VILSCVDIGLLCFAVFLVVVEVSQACLERREGSFRKVLCVVDWQEKYILLLVVITILLIRLFLKQTENDKEKQELKDFKFIILPYSEGFLLCAVSFLC